MATAEDLKDEHLTCSICYMPFTQPKTLQCLHTFCQHCLQQHIDHLSTVRGIPCPVCRHVTVPESSFKPRHMWSQLIKTDFKLAGILEAVHRMEKEKANHGDTLVVTSSLSPGNDRKTQLNTMLQVLRPAVKFIEGKVEEEGQHQRTMGDTRASTEQEVRCFFRQLVDVLKVQEMKLLDELTAKHEISKQESEENIKRYAALVEDTKDTIGLIDRLLSPGSEYATMECLPRIQKQQEKIMRFVSDPPPSSTSLKFSFRANLNNSQSLIRNMDLGSISSTPDSRGNVTCDWKGVQQTQRKSQDTTSESPCTMVPASMDNGTNLVPSSPAPQAPAPREESPTPVRSESSPSRNCHLDRSFETKIEEDSYVPQLKNIVILKGKESPIIIVLDYDNASLKAFKGCDGNRVTSSHRFSGYPQSLAKFTEDRVIVSLMNYKFMVFTADLKQVNTIESDKWYSCLATYTTVEKVFGFVSSNTTSIIGGRLSLLEQVNLKGKVTNKLTNSSSEEIFSEISYICLTKDQRVVVGDPVNSVLLCMTLEGEVVWRLEGGAADHALPLGIAVDSQGFVYVVDKREGRVLQIDVGTGTVVRDVLTREQGLEEPIALAIDSESRIYVTQQNGTIKIFTLETCP